MKAAYSRSGRLENDISHIAIADAMNRIAGQEQREAIDVPVVTLVERGERVHATG